MECCANECVFWVTGAYEKRQAERITRSGETEQGPLLLIHTWSLSWLSRSALRKEKHKRNQTRLCLCGARGARSPADVRECRNKEGGELRGVCWLLWVLHCCFINLVYISAAAAYQPAHPGVSAGPLTHTQLHMHTSGGDSLGTAAPEFCEYEVWRSLAPPAEHMYSL